jgi:hypothetical protein
LGLKLHAEAIDVDTTPKELWHQTA